MSGATNARENRANQALIRHAQAMKAGDYSAALAALKEVVQADASAAPIARLDVDQIFAPLPPVNWLLKPLDLCPGAPCLVAGYGFSGKTVAAQSLALSVASGELAWGAYQTRQGRVLHIDFEQGARLTCERYQRLAAGMLLSPDDIAGRLEVACMPTVYLDSAGADSLLADWCRGFDLVIVDSLRAAAPTLDENSSEIRRVLDAMTRASELTGACFIVIHHARKPMRDSAGGARMAIRGSGALYDACGSVLVFDGPKGEPVRVTHEKARSTGICADDFELTIADLDMDGDPRGGLIVSAQGCAPRETQSAARGLDALKAQVLELMRSRPGPRSRNDVRELLGTKRNTTLTAINELIADGSLVEVGTGRDRRIQCP